MKTPKVNYKIKKTGYEKLIEISVNLVEIEKFGLTEYLHANGMLQEEDTFEILNRYVVLPKSEFVVDKKPFKFKKGLSPAEFEPRNFRVHLHSIAFFRDNESYPKYVDVIAKTKGKSLMQAMNKVGLTEFPENWNNLEVITGHSIENFGMYTLGDENNPYVHDRKTIYHERL